MLPSCDHFWKRSALSDNPDRWFFVISHAYIFWIFQKKNRKILKKQKTIQKKWIFVFFWTFWKNTHLLGNSTSIRPRTVLGKKPLSTPHVASADLSEFECDTLVHAGQMSHLRTCPTSNVTLQSVFVPTRPPQRCAKQELIDKKEEENAHFPLITSL